LARWTFPAIGEQLGLEGTFLFGLLILNFHRRFVLLPRLVLPFIIEDLVSFLPMLIAVLVTLGVHLRHEGAAISDLGLLLFLLVQSLLLVSYALFYHHESSFQGLAFSIKFLGALFNLILTSVSLDSIELSFAIEDGRLFADLGLVRVLVEGRVVFALEQRTGIPQSALLLSAPFHLTHLEEART